jgi:hypothetical protein
VPNRANMLHSIAKRIGPETALARAFGNGIGPQNRRALAVAGAFATVDLYAVDPILLEHAIARRVSLDDAEDAAFNASGSLSPELRRAISGDSLRSSNSGSVGTGDATTPQQKPRSSGGKGDAATPHQIALKAMKLKVPAPPHPERPEEVRMVDVPHAWRVNFLSEVRRALRPHRPLCSRPSAST